MPLTSSHKECARGDLTAKQIELLDEHLVNAGFPASSPYNNGPDTLVSVCLNCGSTVETTDKTSRDMYSEHFDMSCCGLTVIFNSNHRVLVDPSKLTIITP